MDAGCNAWRDGLGRGGAGASATVVAVPNESHGSLNKGMGEPADFATVQVDQFLAGLSS